MTIKLLIYKIDGINEIGKSNYLVHFRFKKYSVCHFHSPIPKFL